MGLSKLFTRTVIIYLIGPGKRCQSLVTVTPKVLIVSERFMTVSGLEKVTNGQRLPFKRLFKCLRTYSENLLREYVMETTIRSLYNSLFW